MRHLCLALLAVFGLGMWLASSHAADCDCGRNSCTHCTDAEACQPCVPVCKSSWDEKKTKNPKYEMKCEYDCDRAHECWCTGPAECRCSPPRGNVFVKKRLYKSDGEEKVEKVPKYEVQSVPAEPCDCARCSPLCWWNPLSLLHFCLGH